MKISKAEYDALPEALKGMFKVDGDGYSPNIITQADLDEQVSGLKAKNSELLERVKSNQQATKDAEDARKAVEEAEARKAGDIAALDKSWQAKVDELTAAHKAELDGATNFVHQTLVEAKSMELATKLAGKSAPLLMPMITKRLQAEKGENGYSTRILGVDGKPSALTIDELEKEFRGNEAYASVIIKPSNGGLGGGKQQLDHKPSGGKDYNMGGTSMLDQAAEIVAGLD